jgi:hypothetical protein
MLMPPRLRQVACFVGLGAAASRGDATLFGHPLAGMLPPSPDIAVYHAKRSRQVPGNPQP